MKTFLTVGFLFAFSAAAAAAAEPPLTRIAFGSCARESDPQPIWEAILAGRPELFLFTGDNIYGDTADMAVMRAKYALLAAQQGFARLRQSCPILATWDDHDFGKGDGGADFPAKRESQATFLDFFGVPANSPRRQQEGIYHSAVFGPAGKRVQILLLDTRYFRSLLRPTPKGTKGRKYLPHEDRDVTLLGPAQWAWLEARLKEPAELRILVSSIQALSAEHGAECWANFPAERARLMGLIRSTRANGVLILSGDRHHAEISRIDAGDPAGVGYALYDITASSLNRGPKRLPNGESNRLRVSELYLLNNYGTIDIDWARRDPSVEVRIRDEQGKVIMHQPITLAQLQQRSLP
ncbi:MAG: alkaline phosphatase D family protein [Opitutaceae bacterium]|nr:alkaline phosphatase D family protein [Opitutaceae bacterium]